MQYDLTDRVTVSGFFGTVQDNYNQRGGTNSPVPLNFIPGTTNPYYLYGVLNNLSYNWGFDADYAFSEKVTFFAEYSHERYHQRMVTRYRQPVSPPTTILTCTNGCDTANNDWESTSREPVDIYSIGADWTLGKKIAGTSFVLPALDAQLGQGTSQRGVDGPQVQPPTLKCQRQFIDNKEVSGRGAEI